MLKYPLGTPTEITVDSALITPPKGTPTDNSPSSSPPIKGEQVKSNRQNEVSMDN
jgi:hypothetical protein